MKRLILFIKQTVRLTALILLFIAGFLSNGISQNVGIGVPNPQSKLDIDGDLRIGIHTSDLQAGKIRYRSKEFEGWDSTAWIPLHSLWTRTTGNNIYRPLGNVGIGWANPTSNFGIQSTGAGIENIIVRRDQVGTIFKGVDLADSIHPFLISLDRLTGNQSYARLAISTDYPDQLTIQRNGKLGFGTNNPGYYTGVNSCLVEFVDSDPLHSDWGLRLGTDNSNGYPAVIFAKSKGSATAPTMVDNGHMLGGFIFSGCDRSTQPAVFVSAAEIRSEVDGNPGNSDMPGRLMFFTTADGSASSSERMRITQRGYVGIGIQTPLEVLDVSGRLLLEPTTAPSGTTSGRLYNVGGTLYWNGNIIGSAGTAVTSVASGNGMNFTTITTTGSVTLGTPGTLTGTSTNAVTTNSHTHAITMGTVSGGNADPVSGGSVFTALGSYLPEAGGTMTGKLNTMATVAGGAGLNLPHGTAPTSPANGDLWTTTAGVYARINSATVGPFGTGNGTVTSVSGTSPISSSGGNTPAISIANAVADGATKGAAAFTAADFNDASGVISIDYTNGQAANTTTKGFLTSADWNTFNNKGSGTVTSVGLSLPAQFTITNSPVTGSGTLTGAWTTQAINLIFAGPASGGNAVPTFRSLVDNDIPDNITASSYLPLAGGTMTDGANIILGTTTGTKIGTATSQKLGFFNATPVIQQTGSIKTAMTTLGLMASPTIPWSDVSSTPTTLAVYGITDGLSTSLTNNYIFVGNASNLATGVAMSGEVSISNTGVATIQPNVVDGTNIALGSDAQGDIMYYNGTDWARLGAGTSGQFLKTLGTGANPAWAADNNSGGTVTSVSGTSPISSSGGNTPAISIANAVADGATKGAAAFTAADFNDASGVISIDYTNGQAANTTTKGFLTSADWNTFNNKGSGTVASVGLSLPAQFTITNSPVTGSGTLTGTWASQTANFIFAAPDGLAGTPTFRALLDADIPNNITASSYLPLAGGTMTGKLNTIATAAAGAGLNLPHGPAPTTPVNGDLWTTTAGVYARVNGTTVGPFGSGGSTSISGLTAATGTNTIDNTSYNQAWNWSTATTGSPLSLSANAITTGTIFDISTTNATSNSTLGLLRVINNSASTTGTVFRAQSNSTAGTGLIVDADNTTGIGTATPTSTLHVGGSVAMPIKTINTTPYNATESDYTILCNNGNMTINLPQASTVPGRIYVIKRISALGTITLDPNGTELIDGILTNTIINNTYECAMIQCDGTAWYIIGKFL